MSRQLRNLMNLRSMSHTQLEYLNDIKPLSGKSERIIDFILHKKRNECKPNGLVRLEEIMRDRKLTKDDEENLKGFTKIFEKEFNQWEHDKEMEWSFNNEFTDSRKIYKQNIKRMSDELVESNKIRRGFGQNTINPSSIDEDFLFTKPRHKLPTPPSDRPKIYDSSGNEITDKRILDMVRSVHSRKKVERDEISFFDDLLEVLSFSFLGDIFDRIKSWMTKDYTINSDGDVTEHKKKHKTRTPKNNNEQKEKPLWKRLRF